MKSFFGLTWHPIKVRLFAYLNYSDLTFDLYSSLISNGVNVRVRDVFKFSLNSSRSGTI